ncbi:MAG: rhomboid family intramembrane serine protease [archaeon]
MNGNTRSAVMWLTGINIVVFILQLMYEPLTGAFLLKSDIIARPWILVTHMFLHGSFMHILFNMYALLMFGGILEQRIGTKRFLILYFSAGIIAGAISSQVYNASLGASGAVMGILAALIVLMPKLRVLFFYAIPMPFWVAGVIWVLLDLFGVFHPTGTANIAHLVGMAVGFLYGVYLRSQKRNYKRAFGTTTHLSKEDVNEYISKGRL